MQKAGMPQTRLDEVVAAKRALSYQLIPTESKLLPTFGVVRHFHQQKHPFGSPGGCFVYFILRHS